ncbi:MAG: cation transporter [Gammaproteobacteria bacterium]|nr:MAG: cation transporter [Gammaproteobacteria bacterium]
MLQERASASQLVTLVGAIVNLLLSGLKLVVGVVASSAALVADGIHSLSDLASDALVWFAAHHAGEEPDEEHPYGHGRFETAATLGLGILLGLVALGIVWDAVERVAEGAYPTPGALAVWAAGISILAKEALYWYTILVARRVRSRMLEANAWHHRSDAISSIVVLLGILGAMAGWPYLDAVAAVVVGAMVAKIGWDLGWEAVQELVDSALDPEQVDTAREAILSVDGVRSIHMLRTRRHGHQASADVHVQVDPRLSVSEGHMISIAVEERLKEAVEMINDVTVHIDPENDEQGPSCRDLPLRREVMALLAERWPQDLPEDREIVLHYLAGHIEIDLELPMAGCEPTRATQLRRRLQEALADDPRFGAVRLKYRANDP